MAKDPFEMVVKVDAVKEFEKAVKQLSESLGMAAEEVVKTIASAFPAEHISKLKPDDLKTIGFKPAQGGKLKGGPGAFPKIMFNGPLPPPSELENMVVKKISEEHLKALKAAQYKSMKSFLQPVTENEAIMPLKPEAFPGKLIFDGVVHGKIEPATLQTGSISPEQIYGGSINASKLDLGAAGYPKIMGMDLGEVEDKVLAELDPSDYDWPPDDDPCWDLPDKPDDNAFNDVFWAGQELLEEFGWPWEWSTPAKKFKDALYTLEMKKFSVGGLSTRQVWKVVSDGKIVMAFARNMLAGQYSHMHTLRYMEGMPA